MERKIDVVIASPDFLFQDKACIGEGVHVFDCRQARYFQVTLDKIDPGIRVAKHAP